MEQQVATSTNEVFANQVKLFGKWNCDEVDVDDISLKVNYQVKIVSCVVINKMFFFE